MAEAPASQISRKDLPQHAAQTESRLASNCRVQWCEDGLKIHITCGKDCSEEASICYRHCMGWVICSPPSSFSCTFNGSGSALEVELSVPEDVLQKLPLLADICSTTGPSSSQFDPDSSFHELEEISCWPGLIGLLMLVGQELTLEQLFGSESCHASVPATILQVADFVGCEAQVEAITMWLLRCVTAYTQAYSPEQVANCSRQVKALSYVPSQLLQRVFLKLVEQSGGVCEAMKQTVMLPQATLKTFVESMAPCVDLRSVELSPEQWTALFMALSSAAFLVKVTELHVAGPVHQSQCIPSNFLNGVSRSCPAERLKDIPRERNYVCNKELAPTNACTCVGQKRVSLAFVLSCGHRPRRRSQGRLMEEWAGGVSHCDGTSVAWSAVERAERNQRDLWFVSSLFCATGSLSELQRLGLHGVALNSMTMHHLCNTLQHLKDSLAELTLSDMRLGINKGECHEQGAYEDAQYGPAQKVQLIQALSCLKKLKILRVPQWQEIAPSASALEPLRALSSLEYVHVKQIPKTQCFVSWLTFRDMK